MNLCSFLQVVTLWGLSGHSSVELSTEIFFFFFFSHLLPVTVTPYLDSIG